MFDITAAILPPHLVRAVDTAQGALLLRAQHHHDALTADCANDCDRNTPACDTIQ
jgi:hypothetical protein